MQGYKLALAVRCPKSETVLPLLIVSADKLRKSLQPFESFSINLVETWTGRAVAHSER